MKALEVQLPRLCSLPLRTQAIRGSVRLAHQRRFAPGYRGGRGVSQGMPKTLHLREGDEMLN